MNAVCTRPPRPSGLTAANWLDAPYHRWAYWQVHQFSKTASISRGTGPVIALPPQPWDMRAFGFTHKGAALDWASYLEQTSSDAIVVLRQGRLVAEWYTPGYGPRDRHLLMSCSKSLSACYLGILVAQGCLDLQATVPDYIACLRGSAWEGCTLQQLLDMRLI